MDGEGADGFEAFVDALAEVVGRYQRRKDFVERCHP